MGVCVCVEKVQLRKKELVHVDVLFGSRLRSWGYSSVVEHSTADREVPGSNPGAPSKDFDFFTDNLVNALKGYSCQGDEFNIQTLKALLMKI